MKKPMRRTETTLASDFVSMLFDALCVGLQDNIKIRASVAHNFNHAPKFPETRFCKGCVLPVLDTVTTDFLINRCGATPGQVRPALRCEGVTTLSQIYTPGECQSGFGGATWGTNFQPIDKSGNPAKSSRGYQPCPDFGVVFPGGTKLSLLGEVKYENDGTEIKSMGQSVRKGLYYYCNLPSEPDKGWDYDFGFGIAYAAGGVGLRQAKLLWDDWAENRFAIATFGPA